MAEETNGNHDGRSRLDRIEAAMEIFLRDHEEFRAEHKLLLRAQVVQQDSSAKWQKLHEEKMSEITDKLDGLIGAVDMMGKQQASTNQALAAANQALAAAIERLAQEADRRLHRLEGEPGPS